MANDRLEALDRLASLDVEHDEATRELAELPARRAVMAGGSASARSAADAVRGQLADNERALAATRRQLEEERDKVKKWEARLASLKHQREFAALSREVEASKRANEAAEATLAQLETAGAALKAQLHQREAEQAARQSDESTTVGEIDAFAARLEATVAQCVAGRPELAARVDPTLLKAYENARRRTKGRALVPVRSGSCSGCQRRMPPQMVVKLAGGAVEPCPSCARLIYLPAGGAA